MSRSEPTYIGEVQSVSGAVVSIQLRDNLISSLMLIDGESYRVGQIGAFIRIPLGYHQLYGVCTQVGAAAIPQNTNVDIERNNRWLSVVLFGEALGNHFDRGVSQYPTVSDEVHLVTTNDLEIIYGSLESDSSISIGNIAASSGIKAKLDVGKLVSRHASVVGSTGSGKSNLTSILMEEIASPNFPSSRIIVIDPHGEYSSSIVSNGYTFKIDPQKDNEEQLYVPYWALPFDELQKITLGDMSSSAESQIRDVLTDMKKEAATHLGSAPPQEMITADSPIPFNIKKYWFNLDDYERRTIQNRETGELATRTQEGNPDELVSNIYTPPSPAGNPPFVAQTRGITRQLELLKNRLKDSRYNFLFNPGPKLSPDMDGKIQEDLDSLVASWVGHDKQISVLDVSGLPSEILSAIVGTMLRIIYDTLFWAGKLPISGRNQPLLIILEEAHLFLPEGSVTTAHRTINKIAKEGRKYGVGLFIITQRPVEIDSSILSQCGTMISLRMSNSADRSKVASAMSDDLGNLAAMLPSLRTGEGLDIGEAMPIPSRILFRKAINKPIGDDPKLAEKWQIENRPDKGLYKEALKNWRSQSFSEENNTENGNNG